MEAYSIGFCNLIDVTLHLSAAGIDNITFFGLSSDNFTKRPNDEVIELLEYIIDCSKASAPLLRDHSICARFFGQLSSLQKNYQDDLEFIEQQTSISVPVTILNILLNYRPDWDIEKHEGFRSTEKIPPCDVIFRSGRMPRLSGFLPLQSANANIVFSRTLWPDIRPDHIVRATRKLQSTPRNFGV
jgi:undecaprenyl diphosphate synthase